MGMLSGDLIAFGIIGLATTLRAASSYWCVEQSGYRGLPHTGVPEIVSPLYPDYSTFGARKISDDQLCCSQLGEGVVGG